MSSFLMKLSSYGERKIELLKVCSNFHVTDMQFLPVSLAARVVFKLLDVKITRLRFGFPLAGISNSIVEGRMPVALPLYFNSYTVMHSTRLCESM